MSAAPKLWIKSDRPMRMNERRLHSMRVDFDTPWGTAVCTRKTRAYDYWYLVLPGQEDDRIYKRHTGGLEYLRDLVAAWVEERRR